MSSILKPNSAIVHGRFQPPHNGHLTYMLSALDRAEHVIIGICTPEICSQEFADQTGYPCTAEVNPFSHQARMKMIEQALLDKGIARERFSFVAFPSDYKNIHEIVPTNTVFYISQTGSIDSKKKQFLESMGYTTDTIILAEGERAESGQKIRASLKEGDNEWKKLVPNAIKEYLENNLL